MTVGMQYESPEELREAIRIYFSQCKKSDTFPDYAGMKIFLKLKERDVKKMCEDPGFADVFEETMYMRESYLARRLSADSRSANGCMHLLKEPINGGYAEKSQDKKDGKLTIVLSGVGGEKACK